MADTHALPRVLHLLGSCAVRWRLACACTLQAPTRLFVCMLACLPASACRFVGADESAHARTQAVFY